MMNPSQNTFFDLSHLCILNILGDNASAFLQGQLSCDVNDVNTHQMRQSAFCNLKGRILALPDVLAFHHILRLILPRDLLEKTQKSLSKTAALSRVTLEEDTNYQIIGAYLKDTNQPLPIEGPWPHEKYAVLTSDNQCAYHLGDGFYILLLPKNKTLPVKHLENQDAWHLLRLQHKAIQIRPESRGLFLPHRLALHLSQHLNFDKGCYRGQEIIARTHYRAKQKHQLQIMTFHTQKTLTPGMQLINKTNHQIIGELLDYCLIKPNQFLIAASVLLDAEISEINLEVAD